MKLVNGVLATSEAVMEVDIGIAGGKKAVYPDKVFVRGKMVVDSGRVVGEKGYGELCSPVSVS